MNEDLKSKHPDTEQSDDTAAAPQQKANAHKQPYSMKQLFADIMDIAEAAVLTVFLFLSVFTFLFRPVTVDGSSMLPTLHNGDQLLICSADRHPKNGQIIVINDDKAAHFSDPEQTELYATDGLDIVIVKRLIARGGQTIDIDFGRGTVTVDGKILDEPYIKDSTTRNDGAFQYPLTIPEGYLFVMGDNRLGSTDSRNPAVALIPEDQVMGVAILRYGRSEIAMEHWIDRFGWLLT